jgi:hypothetical protein
MDSVGDFIANTQRWIANFRDHGVGVVDPLNVLLINALIPIWPMPIQVWWPSNAV